MKIRNNQNCNMSCYGEKTGKVLTLIAGSLTELEDAEWLAEWAKPFAEQVKLKLLEITKKPAKTEAQEKAEHVKAVAAAKALLAKEK